MKLLYIDTSNSGLSGDIFLSAALGLVEDQQEILDELMELGNYLSGVSKLEIQLKKVKRFGINVNKLEIFLKESKHHRKPKTLIEALNKFLESKSFSDPAKIYARRTLDSLINAESDVHDELIENIHLHELSSVDTLIDILGVTRVLDKIKAFDDDTIIYCSKLPVGGGTIKAAHGILPIPAPATVKILEKSNLIIFNGPIESELTTPTGAALLSNLNPIVKPYEMSPQKVIYSTGQKEFKDFMNVLRLFYGKSDISEKNSQFEKYKEEITILETSVDDVSGELLGNFVSNFEKENVLDIEIIPSTTKKNRPSYNVKVLCKPERKFELIEKMIKELGTLGVRYNNIDRICVDRRFEKKTIEISGVNYEVTYKISYIESEKGQELINIKPEYEDLKKICIDTKLSLIEIQFYTQNQIFQIYSEYKEKIKK